MGVTIIKGRCGGGKSRYITGRIKELIADPFAKIIVVVPGQLTFETERKIMEDCGVAGIFGLQVMSMQRLTMKVIEDTGSVSFITNAQKAVIISRALREIPFGEGIPDLEACAGELLGRLKSYGQNPEKLKTAAKGLRDKALSKKLETAAELYARYLELCSGMPDVSDMYAIAAQRASRSDILKGAYLFIDGLDSASPSVLSFLTEAMRLCKETAVTFRSGDETEGDLYTSETKDMRRFIEAAERSGKKAEVISVNMPLRYGCDELEFLNLNLYRYPYKPFSGAADNIRIAEADTMEKEVAILAGNILSEVKAGRRFRDISVVGGGIDGYLPSIKAKFAQSGIPFFYDERRTLADNTFFLFIYSALKAASGDPTETEEYIYSMYSPLDPEERRRLKKYAKASALSGWHYMSPFRRRDSEEAESLRKKAVRPLLALSKRITSGGAGKQIEAIKKFLEECGAGEKLSAFCEKLDMKDTRAEFGYFSQVYQRSMEALDGISEVYGGQAIDPETLSEVVKPSFASTKISLIPPSADEVSVFDVSVARLPNTDVLFAIGVCDGKWPSGDSPGILSSAEREYLFDAGVDLGVFDPSAEKLKAMTTLVKPKKRLYISFSSEAGQPAIVLDRIKRLFPGFSVQREENYISAEGAEASVLGALAEEAGKSCPDTEALLPACACYLKQPGWKEKALSMILRTNAAISLDTNAAVSLFGGLKCSSTRIEEYYKCPYRHFLDYGLKAKPERDYTNDKADTGTLMHLALEIFAKSLIEENIDIKTLSREGTEERMNKAALAAAEEHDGAKYLTDERFLLKFRLIKKELINAALRIRDHFEGSEARILLSEQKFSNYTVDTPAGEVLISGKIDRIDSGGGYYRVVDYKSSPETFSLKEFQGGTALQLPVYIAAAGRILKNKGLEPRPAGGYYMRIGDGYGEDKEEVAKEARMQGLSLEDPDALSALSAVNENGRFRAVDQSLTRGGSLSGMGRNKYFKPDELKKVLEFADVLISKAAENIYSGNNEISPTSGLSGGDACAYCDYLSVCMMDEGYSGNTTRKLPPGDKSYFSCGEPEGGDE